MALAPSTPAPEAPDALRRLRARLAKAGIALTLPTATAQTPLPQLVKIAGEPLSETIVRMREES